MAQIPNVHPGRSRKNIEIIIGLRENLNRKPWFLPSNWLGFPVKIFPSSNSMNIEMIIEPILNQVPAIAICQDKLGILSTK